MIELPCGLCGGQPGDHAGLNHEYSQSGQLIQKVPPKKEPDTVVIAPDYALRALLMDLGVITGQQLMEKEAEFRDKISRNPSQSPTTRRDRTDRQGAAPEGSVRGPISPSTVAQP